MDIKNRSRLLAHIKTGHFRKAFKFTCAICGKSQGTWTGSMVIKSVGCQNKMDFNLIFWEKLTGCFFLTGTPLKITSFFR